MTDAEFEKVRQEVRDHKARTSFPALTAGRDYSAEDRGTEHAEYEAARH